MDFDDEECRLRLERTAAFAPLLFPTAFPFPPPLPPDILQFAIRHNLLTNPYADPGMASNLASYYVRELPIAVTSLEIPNPGDTQQIATDAAQESHDVEVGNVSSPSKPKGRASRLKAKTTPRPPRQMFATPSPAPSHTSKPEEATSPYKPSHKPTDTAEKSSKDKKRTRSPSPVLPSSSPEDESLELASPAKRPRKSENSKLETSIIDLTDEQTVPSLNDAVISESDGSKPTSLDLSVELAFSAVPTSSVAPTNDASLAAAPKQPAKGGKPAPTRRSSKFSPQHISSVLEGVPVPDVDLFLAEARRRSTERAASPATSIKDHLRSYQYSQQGYSQGDAASQSQSQRYGQVKSSQFFYASRARQDTSISPSASQIPRQRSIDRSEADKIKKATHYSLVEELPRGEIEYDPNIKAYDDLSDWYGNDGDPDELGFELASQHPDERRDDAAKPEISEAIEDPPRGPLDHDPIEDSQEYSEHLFSNSLSQVTRLDITQPSRRPIPSQFLSPSPGGLQRHTQGPQSAIPVSRGPRSFVMQSPMPHDTSISALQQKLARSSIASSQASGPNRFGVVPPAHHAQSPFTSKNPRGGAKASGKGRMQPSQRSSAIEFEDIDDIAPSAYTDSTTDALNDSVYSLGNENNDSTTRRLHSNDMSVMQTTDPIEEAEPLELPLRSSSTKVDYQPYELLSNASRLQTSQQLPTPAKNDTTRKENGIEPKSAPQTFLLEWLPLVAPVNSSGLSNKLISLIPIPSAADGPAMVATIVKYAALPISSFFVALGYVMQEIRRIDRVPDLFSDLLDLNQPLTTVTAPLAIFVLRRTDVEVVPPCFISVPKFTKYSYQASSPASMDFDKLEAKWLWHAKAPQPFIPASYVVLDDSGSYSLENNRIAHQFEDSSSLDHFTNATATNFAPNLSAPAPASTTTPAPRLFFSNPAPTPPLALPPPAIPNTFGVTARPPTSGMHSPNVPPWTNAAKTPISPVSTRLRKISPLEFPGGRTSALEVVVLAVFDTLPGPKASASHITSTFKLSENKINRERAHANYESAVKRITDRFCRRNERAFRSAFIDAQVVSPSTSVAALLLIKTTNQIAWAEFPRDKIQTGQELSISDALFLRQRSFDSVAVGTLIIAALDFFSIPLSEASASLCLDPRERRLKTKRQIAEFPSSQEEFQPVTAPIKSSPQSTIGTLVYLDALACTVVIKHKRDDSDRVVRLSVTLPSSTDPIRRVSILGLLKSSNILKAQRNSMVKYRMCMIEHDGEFEVLVRASMPLPLNIPILFTFLIQLQPRTFAIDNYTTISILETTKQITNRSKFSLMHQSTSARPVQPYASLLLLTSDPIGFAQPLSFKVSVSGSSDDQKKISWSALSKELNPESHTPSLKRAPGPAWRCPNDTDRSADLRSSQSNIDLQQLLSRPTHTMALISGRMDRVEPFNSVGLPQVQGFCLSCHQLVTPVHH